VAETWRNLGIVSMITDCLAGRGKLSWVFIAEAGTTMLPVRHVAWLLAERDGMTPGRKPKEYLG
jgi:hypothetical protein